MGLASRMPTANVPRAQLVVHAAFLSLLLGSSVAACADDDLPAARDGGPRVTDAGSQMGGWVSVDWGADLRQDPDSGSVFALVVGLSDVERIRMGSEVIEADRLPRPIGSAEGCDHRAPLSLALVDLDRDGTRELLVHDLCGAYIVWAPESGTPTATNALKVLPDDGAFKYVETSSVGSDTRLVSGSELGVRILRPALPQEPWILDGIGTIPRPVRVSPKRAVRPVPGTLQWLMIGDSSIYALRPENGGVAWNEFVSEPPQPPNLLPFESYDDLELLANADCALTAVGIGRLAQQSSQTPGIPTRVSFDAARGRMATFDIDAEELSAYALSTVTLHDGTTIVGILGKLGSRTLLSVFTANCNKIELVTRLETSMSTKVPPSPRFGRHEPTVQHSRLLGLQYVTGPIVFATYDGYDARVYSLNLHEQRLTEQLDHVHELRDDLAFE